ncbi:TonB-dependent receptor plug domain-containing protein [Falsigemmobacter intermedius]|nr:TonB-dependent receptor [Falsigemmobacter intermedius]
MRSSSLSVLAISIVLPAISAPAFSQTETTLDPVVVSGGLTPMRAADYGRAFSVVTAEEIEKRGITTVQDALRAVPGVSVNGTGREMGQVRIRGGEGDHTLVLIDGVPAAGGSREYMFAGLETNNIERIEVLRGPQAAFFGSNASSGVINIITRKAEGTGYGGQFELGNGHNVSAYTQVRGQNGGLRVSFGELKDNGHDLSGSNGEKDGMSRQWAQLSGDWQATERLSFSMLARWADEVHENDPEPDTGTGTNLTNILSDDPDSGSFRQEHALSFAARYGRTDERVVHHLSVANVISKSRWYLNNVPDRAETRSLKYRAEIGLDGSVASAGHVLNLLAERQLENFIGAYQPLTKRQQSSFAAEYRGNLADNLSLQFGLRHDLNTVYDDFTSWNAAISYQINDQIRLHASAGRARVLPTWSELYTVTSNFVGNPNLKPEINNSIDLGVEFSTADGRGLVDVTLFKERLKNEIYGVSNGTSSSPVNRVEDSDRQGVEVSGRWAMNQQLSFGANYTWLDATEWDGSPEIRRPKHELGLNATWVSQDDRLTLNGNLRLVSGNWDKARLSTGTVTAKMPTYAVVNVAASYKLRDNLTLTGRVNNLFDKDYADAWDYKSPERNIWVGVKADF